MQNIFLSLVIMLAVVSCGKNGKNSGSNSQKRQEMQATDLMWDGQGIEIKEAVIDAPAMVSNSQIVFTSKKTSIDSGDRIKCAVNVNNQETYRLSQSGNKLFVQTDNGVNYDLTRVNGNNGIFGTWASTTRTDAGRIEFKLFIANTHVIIRKTCEG